MTTQFIGVREFRQNMAGLYKKAQKKDIRYVVLNKNKPMFEVRPLDHKNTTLEGLALATNEARTDIKAGRVQSWKSVKKELGL